MLVCSYIIYKIEVNKINAMQFMQIACIEIYNITPIEKNILFIDIIMYYFILLDCNTL